MKSYFKDDICKLEKLIKKDLSLENDYETSKNKHESDINLWDQIITNSPDFFTISHNPSLINFSKTTYMGWSGDQFL